jgi:hypothetical protein
MRALVTWVLFLYYAATIRRGSDTPSADKGRSGLPLDFLQMFSRLRAAY